MKKKKQLRKTEIALLAITLTAFVIRLLFYFLFMNYKNKNGLTGGYMNNAASLLSGQNVFMIPSYLSDQYVLETVHPKGYPVLLALAQIIAGQDYYWILIHILQAAADASVCLFLFRICQFLFKSDKPGVITAVFWCIFPPAISNSVQELPDAFACFLMAWLIYAFYREYSKLWKRYVSLGVVLGLAQYFRPEFMYLFVLVLFAELIRRVSINKLLIEALAIFAMIMAIDSPWLIYSWKVSGKPSFSSTTAWGSAYEGIGYSYFNPDNIVPTDEWVTEKAVENGFDGAWSEGGDEYYKGLVFEFIKKYPAQCLQIVINRLPTAFTPTNRIGINLNRAGSWPPMQIGVNTELNSTQFNEHVLTEADLSKYSWIIGLDAFIISFEEIMPLFSELLLFCMIAFIGINRKRWKQYSFLYLSWCFIPFAICCLKDIESRNVGITLVPIAVAFGFLVYEILFPKEADLPLVTDQLRAVMISSDVEKRV